jgi:branched-chain amino acid transport system substrate-binding protein
MTSHPNPSGASGCLILGLESVRGMLGFSFARMAGCLPLHLCALALGLSGGEPVDRSVAPFMRFRERALEYNGPERDEGELQNVREVNIGWFGPDDTNNAFASDLWCATNLAIQEANDQGGFKGLAFHLVPRWSADPWGSGISQLTRMIYTEQPVALIGSVDSPSTHLAEQVVAKAQLPLVSPISTDKSVTLAGVSWMFSCAPSDDAIARILVNDVITTLENASHNSVSEKPGLALITGTDHASRMTAREVLKELT